ncbi:hypothetical protein DXG01_001909 [Tephrocybe rancida]|nr:hypothetical protein DXG01_001909 [Tephrocybe rancida]
MICLDLIKTPYLHMDDPGIGPFDAVGGKIMTILSPNALWLPKVYLWKREVYLRDDGRFGYDDRMLWPQYYSYACEYFCCIPRCPEDTKDSLTVLWWTPTYYDLRGTDSSVTMELVSMPKVLLAKFKAWQDQLVACVDDYQTTHPRHHFLGALCTAMRHAFIRVSMAMPRDDMRETIPEFQCFCLNIIAWLSYHLKFLPRLAESKETLKGYPVRHDLMGAVTEDPAIVQQLFEMRIPVWRVVLASKLLKMTNIWEKSVLSSPCEMEEASMYKPPRVICVQHLGTLMHHSMQQVGCTFVNKITAPLRGPRPEAGDIGPWSKELPARFAPYPPKAPNEALKEGRTVSVCAASVYRLLRREPDVAPPETRLDVSIAGPSTPAALASISIAGASASVPPTPTTSCMAPFAGSSVLPAPTASVPSTPTTSYTAPFAGPSAPLAPTTPHMARDSYR